MKCKKCCEEYGPEFDEDFINEICLPCRVDEEMEEENRKELKELERWNKKYNRNYSQEEFSSKIYEIDINELKGFPLLKEIKVFCEDCAEESRLEHQRYIEEQNNPTLFDETEKEDLPF